MIYDIIGILLERVVRNDFVRVCQKTVDLRARKRRNGGTGLKNPIQRHAGKYY